MASSEYRQQSRLPDFVVIGAPKCGTTSLFQYLRQHPGVFLPRQKELHYFTRDQLGLHHSGPGDEHVLRSVCATRAEYEAHYRGAGDEGAVGDISPSYFEYPEVSERIRDELKDPRIVLLLRDPIEKAHSQYMHLVRDARETLSFLDALEAEEDRIRAGWSMIWHYAAGSRFADRTRQYLDAFGHDRMRVLLFEDLVQSPDTVLSDLCEFLGVDPAWRFETDQVYNRSGAPRSKLLAGLMARPGRLLTGAARLAPEPLVRRVKLLLGRVNVGEKTQIDEAARSHLRDRLFDDVRELEEILERKLDWLRA
jgi:hypothetical protein